MSIQNLKVPKDNKTFFRNIVLNFITITIMTAYALQAMGFVNYNEYVNYLVNLIPSIMGVYFCLISTAVILVSLFHSENEKMCIVWAGRAQRPVLNNIITATCFLLLILIGNIVTSVFYLAASWFMHYQGQASLYIWTVEKTGGITMKEHFK